MSVAVARSSIRKVWREGEYLIAVRSKTPPERLLELTVGSVRRPEFDRQIGPVTIGLQAWVIPQGVAVALGDCENENEVFAVVDELVSRLEAAGVDARIGGLSSDWYPWPHRLDNSGFSAGMTIVGEPYWDTPGDPGGRRLTQRMWDPDPDARAQVIEHAVRWCRIEDGDLWLVPAVSSFKIPRGQAVSLLNRIVGAGTKCSIVAARGDEMVRRVEFGYNGYVFYELGGTKQPGWDASVEDLTEVLVDVHPLIEWGFVLRRPAGVSGIGSRTSHVVHEALWDPYESQAALLGYRQDPRRHREWVLDVYGVQVLGPGHDTSIVPGGWEVRELTNDRKLVLSRHPEAWFAQPPSLEILLAARASFGPLVDPIWDPFGS